MIVSVFQKGNLDARSHNGSKRRAASARDVSSHILQLKTFLSLGHLRCEK